MTGRSEVSRLRARLDATFKRGGALTQLTDIETQADFARYLCILVSGFLEKAVAELLQEHSRRCGGPTLQRFVESNTRRFANAKSQRIKELLGSFSTDWGNEVDRFLVDEYKAAIDSVIELRHKIAHGGSVGVTFKQVSEYYERVRFVVDRIADLCVPE